MAGRALGGSNYYWSYRALLEDKKRCLTDIPHVKHENCNSLYTEGEDNHKSQRALEERVRHMGMEMNTQWDTDGRKTPPHAFESDANKPHFSHRQLQEEKKKMQTGIRERDRTAQIQRKQEEDKQEKEAIAQGRSASEPRRGSGARAGPTNILEAPTMTQLMRPGDVMETGVETERDALREKRPSTQPHNSYGLLNMKKRFHATKIHAKPKKAMSARELATFDETYEYEVGINPTKSSYQGQYPNGQTSESWPEGRGDPKQPGRYNSHAYFSIDKRRHAARVDGDAAMEQAKLSEIYQDPDVGLDEHGFRKPDFTARNEQYRSQYALQQHKKRHLAKLHSDGDALQEIDLASETSRSAYEGRIEQDLFTSHKSLAYGKRGHVVALSTAREQARRARAKSGDNASSVGSASSCDVGKGISSMMKTHDSKGKSIHTSQVEFQLKKKNHATTVLARPPPPRTSEDGSEASMASMAGLFQEARRPSNPHNSCKAFALKKKYHQTGVHVIPGSRLHPAATKEQPVDKHPQVLRSQVELNSLKKIHSFQYDPEDRVKPSRKPVPAAPVPRNGQWTPQHIHDD